MVKQNVASVIPDPDIEATNTHIVMTTGIKYSFLSIKLVAMMIDLKYATYKTNSPIGIPNARNISNTPL